MKETAICCVRQGQAQFAEAAARRETRQLALKPSAPISWLAGRKRPWKEGCGQLVRIETEVSPPKGAIASASEPPSSSENENSSLRAAPSCTSGNTACRPVAIEVSPA